VNPYFQDLRERVVATTEAGEQTQTVIAATFDVSLSTVEKWLHRKRETGKVTARPHTHGPARTLHHCAKFVRAEVKKQPDITLAELCARVATVHRVKASPSMMCRELQYLHLPRKKVALR
jgi:transposase